MNESIRANRVSIVMGKEQRANAISRNNSRPEVKETAPNLQGQFEDIFLSQWTSIYRLLVRLVGDPAEAEDLALETFIRLNDRPPAPGPELNLGGWLRRVATNLGLNAIRSWKRRERYELDAGKVTVQEKTVNNPVDILAREEENQLVRQILSQMNTRSAQLLVLRHSGMSYQEIAAALGVSPSSIGTLLYRAEKDFERRYRAAGLEG